MPDLSAAGQFWWNWWMQLLLALATIAAVLVALFGQAFRTKFFPPKLTISLASATGEPARALLQSVEGGAIVQRLEDARYYRVRVVNARRWSPATQVLVAVLRVEEPAADGHFVTTWAGSVPLEWMHQTALPALRTVGTEAQADLCSVVKDKWLRVHTLVTPLNLETQRRNPTRLILSVQAHASEADSAVLRVSVSWDGHWHDGSAEMQKHLTVKVLDEVMT